MEHMNPDQFKSRMHSLAYGQAMLAAATDYKQEIEDHERAANAQQRHGDVDIDELLDDPELERLHAERLAALQKESEKRAALQRKGHGEYAEVAEGDFLEAVKNTERVVCHFFHRDFERCKIIDKHLAVLARKYLEARFIKMSAPDAPFFTVKLQVKVLPCLVLFHNGVAVDRTVGFDDFGQTDDFTTDAVERRLLKSGVVCLPTKGADDSDSDLEHEQVRRSVKQSTHARTASDEDSDFD